MDSKNSINRVFFVCICVKQCHNAKEKKQQEQIEEQE